MIHVRFDKAGPNGKYEFFACQIPAVPAVGENINILGNPYVVINRGWAIAEDEIKHNRWDAAKPYAYVNVRPFDKEID